MVAVILAEGFDIKSGSVDVIVPNVFFGNDYRVTCKSASASRSEDSNGLITPTADIVSVRDDKPELQSNSEKFKIVKDGKDWNGCKDGKDKDDKDCKDWNNGNNGGY